MRVLLDECLPRRLKSELAEHDVRTVQELGWGGLANGELLRVADEHFDVLLTADSGLPFQQNLAGRRLAVVAIAAKSNRFGDLQPMMDRVRDAIRRATGGNVVRVGD